MTLIACIEAAALIGTVFLFLRHVSALEQAWAEERRELLTRIQHPQVIPAPQPREFAVPAIEPDEIDLVGVAQEPSEADLQAVG